MVSPDSGKGSLGSFCTPSQAPQLPLVRSSSSKRSLFRENSNRKLDSDDESGMAGMSPLALSDDSSSPFSPDSPSDDKTPFSSLRKLTRAARGTPRKILFPQLKLPKTPPKLIDSDEIVPETPQSCDEILNETPQKSDSPEFKLITPLGSIRKNPSSLPRIHHRRKILTDDADESPPAVSENVLKRHLSDNEQVEDNTAKFPKLDEGATVPKARTALFQEKEIKPLDTKTFYGSQSVSKQNIRRYSLPETQRKPKRNMPSVKNVKKRFGQFNNGVRHGIKRPKPKKPIKLEKISTKPVNELKENMNTSSNGNTSNYVPKFIKSINGPVEKVKPSATITLNDKIKLNVIGKKIALSEKNCCEIPRKKPRIDICLDATDLSVEEPAIEQMQEKTAVNDVLRMLENDWTEEEEEEEVTQPQTSLSTIETSDENFILSPESELSNMTSGMNIHDSSENKSKEEEEKKDKTDNQKKLFPLFRKGFNGSYAFDETNKKRGVKRSWQLSVKNGNAPDQYQLDLGQKYFGAIECKECGVVYNAGNSSDENCHLNYHNSYRTLTFGGWKNERVVYEDFSDRIILVEPTDPKIYWNKINQVLKIVDMDLGLAEVNLCEYQDKRIYLYIRDKTILGVLVAEHKEAAYQMIPELLEYDCCTKETSPVKCGINVVWTAMKYRNQKIATKLVDTLRRSFYYGYVMTLDDIAFSMPTPGGKIFAEKYTKSRNFKVYN